MFLSKLKRKFSIIACFKLVSNLGICHNIKAGTRVRGIWNYTYSALYNYQIIAYPTGRLYVRLPQYVFTLDAVLPKSCSPKVRSHYFYVEYIKHWIFSQILHCIHTQCRRKIGSWIILWYSFMSHLLIYNFRDQRIGL